MSIHSPVEIALARQQIAQNAAEQNLHWRLRSIEQKLDAVHAAVAKLLADDEDAPR
jgi:hypothetical protein